jgi:uncharacterized protein DUF6378
MKPVTIKQTTKRLAKFIKSLYGISKRKSIKEKTIPELCEGWLEEYMKVYNPYKLPHMINSNAETNGLLTENKVSKSVCLEAYKMVRGERASQYGSFKTNAKRILDIYRAVKQNGLVETESDVAIFLVALKLGREGTKHKRDNLIDACGYLELLDELYEHK